MYTDAKVHRLTRWQLRHEQPEPLDLDHEAQNDIAWAADEIMRLRDILANVLTKAT